MTRVLFLAAVCLVMGCGVTASVPESVQKPTKPQPPNVNATFDSVACANALAKQAELANKSPAFKASDVLQGILTQGVECGLPADFAERVRKACPVIGTTPATDLSGDQVEAIRNVH